MNIDSAKRIIKGHVDMMLTTRKISTAMTLNRLVHFCQKIPLIGKLVPDSLYGLYGAKTILVIFANLTRLTKRLSMKALYLGFLIACSSFAGVITSGNDDFNSFLDINILMTFFFFFSFLGASLAFGKALNLDLGTDLLLIDKMHVDAGKYVPARIFERKIIDFFATIPLAILLSFHESYTIWEALAIVPLMTATKIAFESVFLLNFSLLQRVAKIRYKVLSYIYVGIGLCSFCAPFFLVINHIPFSFKAVVFNPVFVIGILLAAVASTYYIEHYTHYRELAWVSVTNYNLAMEKQKKARTQTQFGDTTQFASKLKKEDLSSDRFSHLSGYAYFNKIFFHRHRKFFSKRVLARAIFVGGILIGALFIMWNGTFEAEPDLEETVSEFAFRVLPMCFFFLYTLSMGRTATSAMFANCDSAMLSYPFYRDPKVVIPNFYLRLRTILFYNAPTFSLVTAFALLVDVFSGAVEAKDPGLIDWSMILPYLVTLGMMWLFFSFHDLFIYYILQPYTSELGVKSKLFGYVQVFVWFLAYMNLQLSHVNIIVYMSIIIVTTIYFAVGLLLCE